MQRLRELRHAKGISQQDLADVLHVTQQSIYKYETDKAEPDLDIVVEIANILMYQLIIWWGIPMCLLNMNIMI